MRELIYIIIGMFIAWNWEQPPLAKQAQEIAIRAFRNAIDPPRDFPKEKPPAMSQRLIFDTNDLTFSREQR